MEELQILAAKRDAALRAAEMVADGMVIGLGTGSTVDFVLQGLGRRIADGLSIAGVPTSYQTAIRARQYGIPLTTLDDHPSLDLAIDGADQVDGAKRLIKGGGAALTREKCVAAAAAELVIVVDPGKLTDALRAPVPIEVLPFAVTPLLKQLRMAGGEPSLREGVRKDGPVITDNGNFVVDCAFGVIERPEELEAHLTSLPGVLECGLFTQFAEKTIVVVGRGGEEKI
ncbi:MAG: ribose-5-phosphate isomerase RpiA [Methanomicrobiales archaeon]|nr:ribose-5-phosphate isomerase RpiA [Methanomicrobiales archaeon]MDI6877425.1 ribose-5-phosphate isomerase RpiA [Methanomicrobiales archaeon]